MRGSNSRKYMEGDRAGSLKSSLSFHRLIGTHTYIYRHAWIYTTHKKDKINRKESANIITRLAWWLSIYQNTPPHGDFSPQDFYVGRRKEHLLDGELVSWKDISVLMFCCTTWEDETTTQMGHWWSQWNVARKVSMCISLALYLNFVLPSGPWRWTGGVC